MAKDKKGAVTKRIEQGIVVTGKKTKTRHKSLYKTQITRYEGIGSFAKFAENQPIDSIEECLAGQEALAREVLQGAGLPTDLKGYKQPDGSEKMVSAMIDDINSIEMSAANVLLRAYMVRENIKNNEIVRAVSNTLDLAQAYRKLFIEYNFEEKILIGTKDLERRKSVSNQSKARSAKSKALCVKEAKEMWEVAPHDWKTILSALVEELKSKGLGEVKKETIKRWLKQAGKDGELVIPKEVTNGGRRPTE